MEWFCGEVETIDGRNIFPNTSLYTNIYEVRTFYDCFNLTLFFSAEWTHELYRAVEDWVGASSAAAKWFRRTFSAFAKDKTIDKNQKPTSKQTTKILKVGGLSNRLSSNSSTVGQLVDAYAGCYQLSGQTSDFYIEIYIKQR